MADKVVSMPDGKKIVTHCLQHQSSFLNSLFKKMRQDGDRVVGLGMEYVHSDFCDGAKLSLLSLCTSRTCVFIDLEDVKYMSSDLSLFLNSKDILFFCMDKRNDLIMLKAAYGLEIRNVLDMSELVEPPFSFSGVRKLATFLEVLQLRPRSRRESLIDWTPHRWTNERPGVMNWGLSSDQLGCATVDAYAAYKVAKDLPPYWKFRLQRVNAKSLPEETEEKQRPYKKRQPT